MTRLIHLNGPPGIGKSTLARMYVEKHHGVLNCDVDVLRTLVGGWTADFDAAGESIRPAVLAMISAYLAGGHDVVLPQMLVDRDELGLFEACADDAAAQFVDVFLMDDCESSAARFDRRGASDPDDLWHGQVRAIVAAQGGKKLLTRWHSALEQLIAERPTAPVIHSVEGQTDETYGRLTQVLA